MDSSKKNKSGIMNINPNEKRFHDLRKKFYQDLESTEKHTQIENSQDKFKEFMLKKAKKQHVEKSKAKSTGLKPRSKLEMLQDHIRDSQMPGLYQIPELTIPESQNKENSTNNISNFQDLRLIRDKIHLDQINKPTYDIGLGMDDLPDSIEEIAKLIESSNPFQKKPDLNFVDSEIENYGPIDYSVLKNNFFHMDEKQDIDYFKDLSSYSRKIFKNPK